jgi:hypothetical protein
MNVVRFARHVESVIMYVSYSYLQLAVIQERSLNLESDLRPLIVAKPASPLHELNLILCHIYDFLLPQSCI